MTKLMDNIRGQAAELVKSLDHNCSVGRTAVQKAAKLLRAAPQVFITGIGSSWHAGMALQSLSARAVRPATLVDASELLHFTQLPEGSVVIALSRSGKSVEIVELLEKIHGANAHVIGITNTPESPLARQADAALILNAAFDNNVSITMYSALALVGGLLIETAFGKWDDKLRKSLKRSLETVDKEMEDWINTIHASSWFAANAPTYFLARGGSLASCHEARLLWEEVAKFPASAMTTGGFRHGPQEILNDGMRIGLWIDGEVLRKEDLVLAQDMRTYGAKLFLIGRGIPEKAGDLVINVPPIEPAWQFLIDIVPAQLASEHLALIRGVDGDNFRICPYIIESEGGLRK